MIFEPHSDKQDEALGSEARITLAATGIQWGKTKIGAVRTKVKTCQYTSPDDAFIITAPTYKIMKQSTLPAFLACMRGCGRYNKADAVFEIYGGGTVYLRTETDPDSIVGITNVRHIWGDEAGKYSLYFWENMQGRAAFGECQIDLTTSPYSLNWIFKELINPHRKGLVSASELTYIKAASNENPYFPAAEYERQKARMDPRRFRMMFGGEWERMEGLVYDCFSDEENIVDWDKVPADLVYYAGVDWGFTEPLAIAICGLAADGRVYMVGEVKKARLTLTQIVDLARQKKTTFGLKHTFCGPDQPGHIQELNNAGINASPSENAVMIGVAKVYEMIKSRQLLFVRGQCPHTLDEIEVYHYPDPKDLRSDVNIKEANPVKQNDHSLDALRYCIVSILKVMHQRRPFTPSDEARALTQQQRIAKLLKVKQ